MPRHWIRAFSDKIDATIESADQRPYGPAFGLDKIAASFGRSLDHWSLGEVGSAGTKTIEPGDHLWFYKDRPQSSIEGYATVHHLDSSSSADVLVYFRWNTQVTRRLASTPITRAELHNAVSNSIGSPRNPLTVRVLDDYLAMTLRTAERTSTHTLTPRAHTSAPALPDPGSPTGSDEDFRDYVEVSIARRRGQDEFRARLLIAYGGRCAISRCTAIPALEAAHIAPYRGQNSQTSNGLLLRADLHTLFDLHLIAIDSRGKLMVSSQLVGSEYAALAGTQLDRPSAKPDRPTPSRLAQHRSQFKS